MHAKKVDAANTHNTFIYFLQPCALVRVSQPCLSQLRNVDLGIQVKDDKDDTKTCALSTQRGNNLFRASGIYVWWKHFGSMK